METEQKVETAHEMVNRILDQDIEGSADITEVRELFGFDSTVAEEEVIFAFNLWARHYFFKYFHVNDAPFHRQIDLHNLRVYRGLEPAFVDVAFRGAAKTTRTKLFIAYCIANDRDRRHRYIKHLTEDYDNAKQNVTDVYNMLMSARVQRTYPEIFARTESKREETMSSFTTSTGIKVRADSVGMGQRGDVQEDARPSLLWMEDFENRKVLRSATVLKSIWDNMEEAYTGLSREGGAIYNCNYLSERGNVQKLIERWRQYTLIVPIKGSIKDGIFTDGPPTWPTAFTPAQVETKLANVDDPSGEYLCMPAAGTDVFFERDKVLRQESREPFRDIAGFKMFYDYSPGHRYGIGADVGGGVGLDHSTVVIIDFSTTPSRVVATFKSNTIKPDAFGDEIKSQADRYGAPIVAVENNKFDMCIGRLKQIYDNQFTKRGPESKIRDTQPSEYGWNTNADTKPKMLYAFKKAVEDGHLDLTDKDLIREALSYGRDDLMDRDVDPRLTTRHFDLMIAGAIAYQMKDWAEADLPDDRVIHAHRDRDDARADTGVT
jgi:hypothetical protein